MDKLKMFQYDENKGCTTVCNYDEKISTIIKFGIVPTENTKKLFSEIWSKYNKLTHFSNLNFEQICEKVEDFYSELDIIKSMCIQRYTVGRREDNYPEIFIEYPIIIEIFKSEFDIRMKFHDKFKSFFDAYLEV